MDASATGDTSPSLTEKHCELFLLKMVRRSTMHFQIRLRAEVLLRLNYYEETDSLYIDLSAGTSVDSREVEDGLVLDFDAAGRIVGIDVQHASERLDLRTVETTHLPIAV
jgi:uncharacterized protein YuzE